MELSQSLSTSICYGKKSEAYRSKEKRAYLYLSSHRPSKYGWGGKINHLKRKQEKPRMIPECLEKQSDLQNRR